MLKLDAIVNLEIALMQCRADLLAIELEAKGMEADNQRAIAEGCYPVYIQGHFEALGEKSERVSERLARLQE